MASAVVPRRKIPHSPIPPMRFRRSGGLTLLPSLVVFLAACAGESPTAATLVDDGLPLPVLPVALLSYGTASNPLPAHFTAPGPDGSVLAADNTPPTNPVTDAGATLGRVLFYDVRLSANNTVSCGSCHLQSAGFADTAQFSRGLRGGTTPRHSMALVNARFYARGRFFWDERAATLEDQVLRPIQDPVEMGMTLDSLERKLAATRLYGPLFRAAFGSADVSRDKVARALAQFVLAMTSTRSRYDQAFQGGGPPNFAAVLTSQELEGEQLFRGAGRCVLCHVTNAQIASQPRNIGLALVSADTGAGAGRFKVPSLRNVGVRSRFMHDGRFTSLRQVVDHYAEGVQGAAGLDPLLRNPSGQPQRLGLSPAQRDALVAYLHTLTDQAFLTDPRFADPFRR